MDTTFLQRVATELMFQSDRILETSLSDFPIIRYLEIAFSNLIR